MLLFDILGNDSLIKEDSREKNKEEDLECDLLSKFRELSLENKSLCQPESSTEVSFRKKVEVCFPFSVRIKYIIYFFDILIIL